MDTLFSNYNRDFEDDGEEDYQDYLMEENNRLKWILKNCMNQKNRFNSFKYV